MTVYNYSLLNKAGEEQSLKDFEGKVLVISNSEIQSFCKLNYGVTFPVMGKADVRGESALDLFKYMIQEQKFQGFPPSDKTEMLTDYLNSIDPNYLKDDEVKWNFTKFVIDRQGKVVGRFEPVVKPAEMETFIKELL